MTLTELIENKNKYQKLEKKSKKLSEKNDNKVTKIIFIHTVISSLFLLFSFSPETISQYLMTYVSSLGLSLLTIMVHAKIIKNKYNKSKKYIKLFKHCNKKTEKIIRKNSKFFKQLKITNKNKKFTLNNLYYSVFVKLLEKSSQKEIEANYDEISEYLKEVKKENKREINTILSKKLKVNARKVRNDNLDRLIKVY